MPIFFLNREDRVIITSRKEVYGSFWRVKCILPIKICEEPIFSEKIIKIEKTKHSL